MKKGFFRTSQVESKAISRKTTIAQCGKCKLKEQTEYEPLNSTGEGETPLLNIGNRLSSLECKKREHFIDGNGKYYERVLRRHGIELKKCTNTSVIQCPQIQNKKLKKSNIDSCFPNVKKIIEQTSPQVIIGIGDQTIESLISPKFDKSFSAVSVFRGFAIPDRDYKAWVCPVFSPSYILAEKTASVAKKIFDDDIAQAVSLLDVPLPSYINEKEEDKIEILRQPKEINAWLAATISKAEQTKLLAAFDFETSGLKPHHPDQFIRTCAISLDPHHAVAFPMQCSTTFLSLFAQFLYHKNIYKIAANMKFENDWANVKLRMPVKNWFFDTMIGMHYVDNRQSICSLEFMNYVYFGIEPYDSHIKKFIKKPNSKGNEMNDIAKADLHDLLIYNGMDAMTEFRHGIVQMEQIGIKYGRFYSGPSAEELAPQYFLRRD